MSRDWTGAVSRRLRLRPAILTALALIVPAAASAGLDAPKAGVTALSVTGRTATGRTVLGLGILHMQLRDRIVAPIVWRGIGPLIAIGHEHAHADSRRTIDLRLPIGLLTNRYEHRCAAIGHGLAFGWVRRVGGDRARGIFAGALIRENAEMQVYADWDDEHLYWVTSHDLAAAMRYERLFGDGRRITSKLTIPILSLVSRPPRRHYYKIDDLENIGFYLRKSIDGMRLTSPPAYFFPTFACQYSAHGPGWRIGLEYELRYLRYTHPEAIQILTSSLTVQVTHGS
jgi:hypothetical protein